VGWGRRGGAELGKGRKDRGCQQVYLGKGREEEQQQVRDAVAVRGDREKMRLGNHCGGRQVGEAVKKHAEYYSYKVRDNGGTSLTRYVSSTIASKGKGNRRRGAEWIRDRSRKV